MAVARVPLAYDGLIIGRLVITDDCVWIEGEGERELVIWPEYDKLSWDMATRSVRAEWGDEIVSAKSGDRVTLGGADLSEPIQGQILESLTWVAPPHDGCMTPIVFFSNGEIRLE